MDGIGAILTDSVTGWTIKSTIIEHQHVWVPIRVWNDVIGPTEHREEIWNTGMVLPERRILMTLGCWCGAYKAVTAKEVKE